MTEEKKSYYAVIPANVRYDKSLSPNAKLLYGEITALCNAEGYCWASNKYFADLYGVADRTIRRWLRELNERDYIKSRVFYKKGSKEIEKRFITITQQHADENVLTLDTELSTPQDENVLTPTDKNVPDNNTVINNTFNNKKVSKNSFDEIIDGYLSPDGESIRFEDCSERRELLQEWLKVRKAKRAAMTDRAIQMNINKLDELATKSGMTVTEYLGEVIRRGWAAFFEIKNYDNKNQATTNKNEGWCMPEANDIDDLSDLF